MSYGGYNEYGSYGYSSSYGSYSGPPIMTPEKKAHQLLMDICFEQRKAESEQDADLLASLRAELKAIPHETVTAVFDSIVDNGGW